ncbi:MULTISPECIES: circadian clock KaiB family protein [Candidatus Chloroploca]|uniref:Circadian clock protein KaiB n=1 Tax=Candidatus Chloroploca asiatica TaxID=1506545 RepID=A0A2H3KMK3_9CHLR|nr:MULTISPECIES: circadian clock KaiB family protein [Candidatus Chloroploca]PDV99340.1 circadian clock protein KaiB [Candidatus Chloroploca asiatica]
MNGPAPSKIVLHLYVAGRSPRAERAIATLRRLCERELARYECDLVIIDVLADPQQAEARKILATPTLIKEFPEPPRRIIGDLGVPPEELLAALNLPYDGL